MARSSCGTAPPGTKVDDDSSSGPGSRWSGGPAHRSAHARARHRGDGSQPRWQEASPTSIDGTLRIWDGTPRIEPAEQSLSETLPKEPPRPREGLDSIRPDARPAGK